MRDADELRQAVLTRFLPACGSVLAAAQVALAVAEPGAVRWTMLGALALEGATMALGYAAGRSAAGAASSQARVVNQRNTDLIRQRASLVKTRHPAFERLIDEYVARQERETQVLGTDVLCAIWVLQMAQQQGLAVPQGEAAGQPLRGPR